MKAENGSGRREAAAATLFRTARELRKVMAMVEDLEDVVGQAISRAGQAETNQMLELQKLDHLLQKIMGVADFLDALASAMPREWRVDALAASRSVLLADLGAKLGAEAASRAPVVPLADAYEVF
jgi:hypothetical protein